MEIVRCLLLSFPSANSFRREVILIQLFIAVINENFQVAEETKREQQVAEHLANRDITVGRFAWISKLNPYKYTKSKPKSLVVESLPSNLILPMRKAVIQDRSVLSTNNFFASAVGHFSL